MPNAADNSSDHSSNKLRDAFFQNTNNNGEQTDFFAKFNEHFNKGARSSYDDVSAFGAGLQSTDVNRNGASVDGFGLSESAAKKGFESDRLGNKFDSLKIGAGDGRKASFGFEEDSFADFAAFDSLDSTKPAVAAAHNARSSPRQLKPIRSNDFEQLNKKNNRTNADQSAKKSTKFQNDYSQADHFDDDLKAALERSMVDQ